MLIDMDKSTNEKNFSQPFQTNNNPFEVAITFLAAYIGIFIVTTINKKFHLATSFTG